MLAEALTLEYRILRSKLSFNVKRLFGSYSCIQKNQILQNSHAGKPVFVIANGPSLASFDVLSLANQTTITLNRSVSAEFYESLAPNFHIFVDPKIVNGQWPIALLDEVLEKSPRTRILLNADWYSHPLLERFRYHESFFWMASRPISLLGKPKLVSDMSKLFTSYYVAEHAISLGIYLGASQIACLGYEGNGIARLLLNQDSHFDGKDPDFQNLTPEIAASAMNHNSRYLREVSALARAMRQEGHKVYNLTPEGIMTMFERQTLEDFLASGGDRFDHS